MCDCIRFDYVGCFEDPPVDCCEIRYMDFVSLQIRGVLHIGNIEHLKLIPDVYLAEEQYLVQAIKAILENNKEGSHIVV